MCVNTTIYQCGYADDGGAHSTFSFFSFFSLWNVYGMKCVYIYKDAEYVCVQKDEEGKKKVHFGLIWNIKVSGCDGNFVFGDGKWVEVI